jgi:hypothetical protein
MTDINTHVKRRSVGYADECPALVELSAHRTTPDADIARHVENCPRCRALVRELPTEHVGREAPDLDLPPIEVPERSAPPGALAAGELVTLASDRAPGSLLVALVLDVEANAARVAPIIACADLVDDDSAFALLPAETPLGYEAAVDVDCVGWIDVSQVEERLGGVDDELLARAREALAKAAVSNEVSLELVELRDEASMFYLPTFGKLYREAEASKPALEADLQTAGWTPEGVAAIRSSAIDQTKVTPEQMTTLFRLAGWTSDGARVERDAAIRALRLALAEPLAVTTMRSKATAATMAFLAQMPGMSKRTLTADEYVDAVIRALDESDS